MTAEIPRLVENRAERLSLIIGGPFHSLLGRLGLLGPDRLPGFRAAAVLAAVAWLLPASLALLQAYLTGDRSALAFFLDHSTIARFLVAVFALVATERRADVRTSLLIDNFRDAHLVGGPEVPAVEQALARADRRTSSGLAEALMLIAALVLAGLTIRYTVHADPSAWEGRVVDGGVSLTWAGIGVRYVSAPLLQFLLLRWLWRFAVWTGLLFRLSRIPLRLSVLHPDRSGGLGFLALYPPVFNGLVFAISAGMASSFIRDLGVQSIALQTVQILVAAWVILVVVLTIGPLVVFTPRLLELRDDSILKYGALAAQFHQGFEKKWFAAGADGADLLDSGHSSAAADLNTIVAAIWELRLVPVDRETIISVVLAAGVPMLAVLATEMPIKELVTRLVTALA